MAAFTALQSPLHSALSAYDPTSPPSAQPASIAPTFLDAMAVRQQVFVSEQHIPLCNEHDADDARSYHWVVYASVAQASSHAVVSAMTPRPSAPPVPSLPDHTALAGSSRNRSGGVPVGTIRLVPAPHAPAEDRSALTFDAATSIPRRGCLRRFDPAPTEPYVKLGRLAVAPGYRGLGLGRLLVGAALGYAAEQGAAMATEGQQRRDGVVRGALAEEGPGAEGGGEGEGMAAWRGLVLVHAQVKVEGLWSKEGFVRDCSMGDWEEEGIRHVGMWKRVEIVAKARQLDPITGTVGLG